MSEQVATPEAEPEIRLPDAEVADPYSAMTARFSIFFRWFARRYIDHLDFDASTTAALKELEERGAVVYVMRYASRLDYFLFNTLFARRGLRLSAFANGLSFYYYQPFWPAFKCWWQRRRSSRSERREDDRRRAQEKARAVVCQGESMFLFLRTQRIGSLLRGREAAVAEGRRDQGLLAEILKTARDEDKQVALVPLALFWRKGPRVTRGFLNLTYGAPTRPTDIAKVTSFLMTYQDLAIRPGMPIDLRAFMSSRSEDSDVRLVRKLRRAIQMFLFREERIVEGPTLRPRHRVQEVVLASDGVRQAVAERARDPRTTPEAARAQAEKVFREIAANMNSTFLAILNVAATWIFRKLFVSIETSGLERVSHYAKDQPVVLVPSHRSYFDFLILSWLFYGHHMMPPHIASRDNMAFGPFGFLWRTAGAFFMRRSFDDPVYKAVFRAYLAYLVKEGFTQEFFIEGGRSRTGKSLSPRMGMLNWNIQAFLDSGRKDLIFVPVGITYERLVEESAMVDELEGGGKQQESMVALMRARKVLQRRFGSVFLCFGEAVSLAKVLEGHEQLFLTEKGSDVAEDDPAIVAQRHDFTERLANDLVERINWSIVANATSVAACALLGEPRRGLFRHELVRRMAEVVELLNLQDVRLTPAFAADEPEFEESISFLLRSGLIKSENDPRGEILYFEDSNRRALIVYRNTLFHFLMAPSLIARQVLLGGTEDELTHDLEFWLDLLYHEFFAPKALVQSAQRSAFLDYFERIGVLERFEDQLRATEKGQAYFGFLAEQTRSLLEAYHAAFSAIAGCDQLQTAKQLEKAAEEQFRRASLIGEVHRSEGWNPVTFRNALELLARRGIVEKQPAEGRAEALYVPGEAHGDLSGLLGRLAGALGSR
ncbi:MAG: hypothetical protein GY723_11000 [bacterium]|nr:hypothetical protein [bacterium]